MAFRDLVLKMMPAGWRGAAVAASKEWKVTFAGCPHSSTWWDVGGLRWGAAGSFTTRARCPVCGTVSHAEVRRDPAAATPR